MEKGLDGELEEDEEENVLDLFSRMDAHSIPSQENIRPTIQIMAHKAKLREPKYIIDCFSEMLL